MSLGIMKPIKARAGHIQCARTVLENKMGYRVGVDIGGSFTDFAVFDEESRTIRGVKTFSRPDEPGSEVLEGIRLLEERYGIKPSEITYFTHGTTVGINAVIQRRGLKLALFVTRNFGDVLELGRLKVPDMYSLLSKRPEPLVTRDMVFEIDERMGPDGQPLEALSEPSVEAAVAAARARGAEGIVVAFLHSYRNPGHEVRVRELVQKIAPEIAVTCSSETWPIIREYERTITAVIGGYVQPRVAHYLGRLQAALKKAGVTPEPRLTKSNGGVMTAEQGKRDCVQMILSGTAAGVIGAAHVAAAAGIAHCMSLDIGGTSADIAVITDGRPQYGVGELIGDFQIYIPSISVSSVGEGGGSIAWVDALGVLKVGPDSAGSRPGPACYGRGGTRATITDAVAACGLLGHSDLGYKAVSLDVDRARAVVGELADKIGKTVSETAEAIIQIAVSGMFSEVSAMVSRYGIELRDFSMLAFGGAGPMLGCFLSRELGVKETVVPPSPGVLSALGGLIADLKNDFLKTVYLDLTPASAPAITTAFAELGERARRWLEVEQGYSGPRTMIYSAELRYRGQSFELDTPLDPDAIAAGDITRIARDFHDEHRRIYGHSDPSAAVQVISLRVVIAGQTEKPEFPRLDLVAGEATPQRHIEAWMDGAMRQVALLPRSTLLPGQHFMGPAVVAQDDCTTVILPDHRCTVDAFGNLRIVKVEV